MRNVIVAMIGIAVLAVAGCGSSEPSAVEQRAQLCETFSLITPGMLEMQDATAVLADPGSTPAQRAQAMKASLDEMSSHNRTRPYDCNVPADARLFEKFVDQHQSKREG